MKRHTTLGRGALLSAVVLVGALVGGSASAQTSTTGATSSGAKTLYIIGGYETKGESSQAVRPCGTWSPDNAGLGWAAEVPR